MKPRIITPLLALSLLSAPLQAVKDTPADDTAAPVKTAPGTRVEPDPDGALQADLARALEATTEIVWLEAGDKQSLALFEPHNTREQLGNVLILHDQRTNADWPELVSTLRKGLPDKGWATLALQLPSPPAHPLPKRASKDAKPEAAGGGDETANPAAETTTYDQRLTQIADAAFDYLQEREGKLVVLGIGSGATWATTFVRAREQSSQQLSLVMVDSQQPEHPQAPDLMTLLPELSSTVLDLYHGSTLNSSTLNENRVANPRSRINLAKRSKLDNYHHSRLPLLPGDRKKRNQWILSRVRGFMQTHIVDAAANGKPKQPRRYQGPRGESGPGQQTGMMDKSI